MAFPRLPALMLLASFILLVYWTTSSAESHDPTSADLSPPYRVTRDLKGDVEASSQVVKDTLTVVKEVLEKIDPKKLSAVMKGLANFASLAPGIGSLASSVIIVVLNFTPQEDAQKELFAEVNRKLDSLSIQISNLATDVEWFNYASVYSQDEVRILNAWKKFNEFRKNSELVDSEEAKLRLAEVFTSYYENTATEASVANLYLYLTVSSTSLSGNLNELLKKKFKCGISEIGKYNLYFSSLLWKGMVLNQVYWNLIGLKPSGKEAEHTDMFKMVYKAQKSVVGFCLDNYKQYMIKDVEEISKANSPDNKTDIAVQVKNKLDEKYNWYNWVVLVYDSAQETYHILYDLTKIPVGKITVAVGNIRNPEEKGRALQIMSDVNACYRENTGKGIGDPVFCGYTYPQVISQCLHDSAGVPVKMIHNVYNYDVGLVPETLINLHCLTAGTYSRISVYFSGRITPCSDNTCDRGECKRLLEGTNEHLCECPEGWGGDRCEQKMDPRDVPVTDIGQAVPDISTISARLKLMEANQKRMEAKLDEILGTLRNRYILSIDNADEIVEYVGDLLQGTEGKKQEFVDELVQRWQRCRTQEPDGLGGVFRIEPVLEGLDTTPKDNQKKTKRKGRNKQEIATVCQAEPEPVKTPIDLMKAQENSGSSSVKKKNKFVNLYAKEGGDKLAVLLPGRQSCECLAQKHRLVNNCLSCGRIVCEQEGSGPCLFCGSLVCTNEEQEILQRDSNKSQKLRKKLMGEGTERDYLPHQEARMKTGLEKAVKHKDKLLEFDKNSVKRTQVLDDESDYFATDSNQWLSPGEREALRKRDEELRELRHASRKDRKITLDFAGRRVLNEGENLSPYYQKFDDTVKDIHTGSFGRTSKHSVSTNRQQLRELVNPNIVQAAPEWVDVACSDSSRKSSSKAVSNTQKSERSRLRLQDKELQEMSDGGWCLSMHQPWASLLIKGIKRVEGRTWYTSHRGRLWIAAAANRATPQEIAGVEAMYRQIYRDQPQFPAEYPTGCLLGCVNVTECLSQEQFREQYPKISEESTSPFVFICSNPQELVVKFPMKGKHKIWKLESQSHQSAKKCLMQPA